MDINKDKNRIINMFRDDVQLSIDYNDSFKNRILEYRMHFYADNKKPPIISKGSWFTYNVFSQRDIETESMRDLYGSNSNKKKKKSPFGNYSNVEWKLTRKLGEPLIANVAKPLIETYGNIDITTSTDRNVIKKKVIGSLLNHFNDDKSNRNDFYKRLSRNCVVDGTAFGRIGFTQDNNEFKIKINKKLYDKLRDKYKNSKAGVVKRIAGKYYFIDNTNKETKLTKSVLDPIACHFDPIASAMDDKRFFIVMENISVMELYRRYGDVLDDNKIDNLADGSYTTNPDTEKANKILTLYEYWTKIEIKDDSNNRRFRMHRMLILTPYYEDNEFKAEIDKTEIVSISESPYSFNRIPFFRSFGFDGENQNWGDGISEFTMDLQKLEKTLINAMIDNVSNGNLNRWFVKKGIFDVENKKALEQNMPLIEVNRSIRGSIKDNLYQAGFNELPSSVFNMFELISQQSEETTGVNKTMTGSLGANINAPSSNFSAGMSLAQVRTAMIISNIKDSLIDMNKMLGDLCIYLFSDEEINKITGINIDAEFVKYANEKVEVLTGGIELDPKDKEELVVEVIKEARVEYMDIDSKFDINIKVASEASKDIQSAKILNLIQNIRELGKTLPDDVVREFIAELADNQGFGSIVNKIRNYKEQPNPIAQQLDQLEVASKTADVKVKEAEAEKSKALAENAKSRSVSLNAKTQQNLQNSDLDRTNKSIDTQDKQLELENKKTEMLDNIKNQNQTEGDVDNGHNLFDQIFK